jgi:purine-cytosine permease-like protein
VEDLLGLTTVTGLLTVVTTLTLSEQRGLAGLVLGDLVLGVLAALLALAYKKFTLISCSCRSMS